MHHDRAEPESVYHLTHWKAGSQWVRTVLQELQGERFVEMPDAIADGLEFCPVEPGRIYSPLYLNRLRFEQSPFARAPHRKFLVIRDLRDVLVSWYFSLAKTHGENAVVLRHRAKLNSMDLESGLLYLLDHEDFFGLAMICSTWLGAQNILTVRFEDLVENPESMFARICVHCGFEVDPAWVRDALERKSFRTLTGRPRGTVDPGSHYRRGVPGDWENHFTERVRMEFSRRYDDLLWRCGYAPIMPPGYWKKQRQAAAV